MNGLAFGVALVAYNNAMNLWTRFHGRLYVPANLTLSAASLAIAMLAWDLEVRALGLHSGQAVGLLVGVMLGIVAASPLFLAFAVAGPQLP